MKKWEMLPGEQSMRGRHEIVLLQPDGGKFAYHMEVTNQRILFYLESAASKNVGMVARMGGGLAGLALRPGDLCEIQVDGCINRSQVQSPDTETCAVGGNWNIVIDSCINEGDINTSHNAGGIVCFVYSVGNEPGRKPTISNCANRGNLRSEGTNNYMGGILGVDALACVPVNITGCTNEGDLEYTREVLVDAQTLSGVLVTLSRTSGGIVGYVGTAPYIMLNSGARSLNNINEDAYLNIASCSSTGRFIHKGADLLYYLLLLVF